MTCVSAQYHLPSVRLDMSPFLVKMKLEPMRKLDERAKISPIYLSSIAIKMYSYVTVVGYIYESRRAAV